MGQMFFMSLELKRDFAAGWNGLPLTVDTYGPNPYVTDLSVAYPGVFAAASQRQSAPTLFAGGDLPPFTASGLDPEMLIGLPFAMRHAAASEVAPGQLLEWIELATAERDRAKHMVIPHSGLEAYRQRVNSWVHDLNPSELEQRDEAAYPGTWNVPQMFTIGRGVS
jgi:hypothetical protein